MGGGIINVMLCYVLACEPHMLTYAAIYRDLDTGTIHGVPLPTSVLGNHTSTQIQTDGRRWQTDTNTVVVRYRRGGGGDRVQSSLFVWCLYGLGFFNEL